MKEYLLNKQVARMKISSIKTHKKNINCLKTKRKMSKMIIKCHSIKQEKDIEKRVSQN